MSVGHFDAAAPRRSGRRPRPASDPDTLVIVRHYEPDEDAIERAIRYLLRDLLERDEPMAA